MATAQTLAGPIQITKNTLAGPYYGVDALVASSGNKANADATATLTGAADAVVYMAGLLVTGSGASNHKTVIVTVNGLAISPLDLAAYTFEDDLVANDQLVLYFNPPLRAADLNAPIKVTCPASGVGGLNNMVFIWGYASRLPLT
jgi:hypothetical protein